MTALDELFTAMNFLALWSLKCAYKQGNPQ